MLNGSYKLKEIDGQVINVPVNGELLKKYYSREGFIPYVIVWTGVQNLRVGEFVTFGIRNNVAQ